MLGVFAVQAEEGAVVDVEGVHVDQDLFHGVLKIPVVAGSGVGVGIDAVVDRVGKGLGDRLAIGKLFEGLFFFGALRIVVDNAADHGRFQHGEDVGGEGRFLGIKLSRARQERGKEHGQAGVFLFKVDLDDVAGVDVGAVGRGRFSKDQVVDAGGEGAERHSQQQ